MSTHTLNLRWEVRPYLMPDRDDDPMGVYCVEPVSESLTEAYLAAEPDTPELEAVHAENRKVAALIAAAPDLLEALKLVEPLVVSSLAFVDCNAQLRLLRAAIAKAEGKVTR